MKKNQKTQTAKPIPSALEIGKDVQVEVIKTPVVQDEANNVLAKVDAFKAALEARETLSAELTALQAKFNEASEQVTSLGREIGIAIPGGKSKGGRARHNSVKKTLIEALKTGPLSPSELSEKIQVPLPSINSTLQFGKGKVFENVERGLWQLCPQVAA